MGQRMAWGFVIVPWWFIGAVAVGAEETVSSADKKPALSMVEEKPAESSSKSTSGPEGKRVSMNFEAAKLSDVLKTFSQETGINVIASAEVREQPITLYLEDVTPMDALDQILSASKLTYERPVGSDIYIVKPKGEGPAATITRVYRLKYAQVSSSVLAKTAASFATRTPFEASLQPIGGGGGGGGGGGAGKDVGIDQVISRLLTEKGEIVVDGRTNSLVITDIPENFPRIEAALVALDVRTAQIMVDAELIETSLTKLKDLGFKWGDSSGKIFQLTPAKGQTRFPFSHYGGQANFGGDGLHNSTPAPKIDVLGTLDFSQATMVLDALESDSDTKILARPKVLTLDNQSAVIRLTTNEAIGFATSAQSQTGTTTSTPERETTGVVLVVTPQLNEQSYITMLVEPSVTKTVASKLGAPKDGVAPKDPKTRSSRTMVRIRSGDTLVVGGLIDRSESEGLRKVPIFGDMPVLGDALFRNKTIDKTESELIVFITPRVLDEPSVSQLASSVRVSPMGMREQEPTGARQDSIEQTLNQLEKAKP